MSFLLLLLLLLLLSLLLLFYHFVAMGHLADSTDAEAQDWAIKACQRCLICLGDLGKL